ncbi:hypothetical protein [Burkholderia gladioli]|uniref:hypothetical protein n=1 Tax=Burkholderia gladioli TaxID=28095 RepID=UPI000FD70533|nr:hypothetical protein [Burkholderia gladioli]
MIRRRRQLVDAGAPRDGLGDRMRPDHGVHVGVLVLLLGAVADERHRAEISTGSHGVDQPREVALTREEAQWSTP